MSEVIWTEYLRYRAQIRGFDLAIIEQIVRFSGERYYDTSTLRWIAVGRHRDQLVVIPYEDEGETIVPISIHATTRQQLALRVRSGRFRP
jgi:hypothetical protein